MKNIILILSLLPSIIWAQTSVSNHHFTATSPSFTTLPSGKPVVSWIEEDSTEKKSFYYSIYENGEFGEATKIPTPDSIATHAEGMPRLAFKATGEMLLTYEMAKGDKVSRFGSDLYFQSSKDGVDWSFSQFVNSERNPAKSSSFSKPVRLSDGEIGIAWLDENLTGKGRSVKFTKTSPAGGLETIRVIDEQACNCCRVELIADNNGFVSAFYRNLADGNTRDIHYVESTDNGVTWSSPDVVYEDNWVFEGCPHTGPSATLWNGKPLVAWFCGSEEKTGVKLTDVNTKELIFDLVSLDVRNPQIASNNQNLAMVYSEITELGESFFKKIVLETIDVGGEKTKTVLTEPLTDTNMPCILSFQDGYLIAYESKNLDANSQIVCTYISSSELEKSKR